MILHRLSDKAEHSLRVKFVNSDVFDDEYNSYRDYIMRIIPAAINVTYRDNPDYIESIVFKDENTLAWFMLGYL